MRDLTRTRFDEDTPGGAIGELPNLADLMLVFAVGLIAALAASSSGEVVPETVEAGPELPQLPGDADDGGQGLQPIGRVFEDPETGTLYVVRSSDASE